MPLNFHSSLLPAILQDLKANSSYLMLTSGQPASCADVNGAKSNRKQDTVYFSIRIYFYSSVTQANDTIEKNHTWGEITSHQLLCTQQVDITKIQGAVLYNMALSRGDRTSSVLLFTAQVLRSSVE